MVFKSGVEIHRMSHDNSAAMRMTTGNNLSYWMSAVAINTAVLLLSCVNFLAGAGCHEGEREGNVLGDENVSSEEA